LTGKPIDVPKCRDETYAIAPLWWVKQSTGKAFIDYQNDVTVKDLPLAAHEGYRDVELAKRYTTTGMATDQGKLGNVNAIAVLAEATGQSMDQVGTTTFRPYYTPVSFGALAGPFTGHHFQPVRRTPLHEWAEELDAVFVETGLWMRSSWFPLPHEKDWLESVIREVKAVRESVGLCDVSTLGKIDVQGAGCRRVPQPSSIANTFSDARRGQGALRSDAARRRHRLSGRRHHLAPQSDDALTHDHDDGQCRAASCRSWNSLPPGAVARSEGRRDCLGDRAMGAAWRSPGRRRRDDIAEALVRHRPVELNGAALIWAAKEITILGGMPHVLVAASPFRASMAYEVTVGAGGLRKRWRCGRA
jgi:hypothetical protein